MGRQLLSDRLHLEVFKGHNLSCRKLLQELRRMSFPARYQPTAQSQVEKTFDAVLERETLSQV